MKQRQRFEPWRQFLFSALILLAMSMAMTACSSEEEDINYTAEVMAFDSTENLGRAKIIHSAKDDKHSERLMENAQFLLVPFPQGISYDLEEGCIITFKPLRKITSDNITIGLLTVFEIEITKITRK